MRIDIHIHETDEDVIERLDRIESLMSEIIKGELTLMGLSQDSKDLLSKIDKSTTAIGDRIQRLLDNPNTTEAEFRAALGPIAEHLDALGKDQANPFPTLPTA